MKKVIAVLLAVLCVVSLFSFALQAAAEDDSKVYAVIYTQGGVPLMYSPTPSFRFDKPGTVTISADTPLAVDYEFVCWIDKDGNKYYPGQKVHVDSELKLQPKMAPKTDDDSHTTRVIKTALESLIRVLSKAFGTFKTLEDYVADNQP